MEKEQKIAQEWNHKRFILASVALSLLVVGVVHNVKSDAVVTPLPMVEQIKVATTAAALVDHKVVPAAPQSSSLEDLEQAYFKLDAEVREIKSSGVIMETDAAALAATTRLQAAARRLLHQRYGSLEPYRVRVTLEFQPSMPDYAEKGGDGSFLIETAPSSLIPYSVYNFLEIARTVQAAAFHRNAGHVLQARVRGTSVRNLAFQEYHRDYPHQKGTTGYCGRPSGPCFYVSIQDNTRNHGPGSQQKKNPYEADALFGRVVEGFQDQILDRVHKMPFKEFTGDPRLEVKMPHMQILVPDGSGGYKEWTARPVF